MSLYARTELPKRWVYAEEEGMPSVELMINPESAWRC